ncbi:MAG: lytic transglycosylase domain-containing protein, partial [Candidatus Cryptobacteroides sp.]
SSFGFDIDPLDYYPAVKVKERLTISEGIPSLVDFALEHGTSYKRLKETNLWLRDSKLVNKAQRTYSIIIPEQ